MAMDMFLNLEDVEGGSADRKMAGAIDVLAWSWGLSQSGSMHSGGGGGVGRVSVQDLSLTKYIDKSSTALMHGIFNLTHYGEAILTCRKSGGEALDYLVITMEDVIITSISTGGSGGEDLLTENVTLQFGKVKVEYTEQSPTGGAGASSEVGFDIVAGDEL